MSSSITYLYYLEVDIAKHCLGAEIVPANYFFTDPAE